MQMLKNGVLSAERVIEFGIAIKDGTHEATMLQSIGAVSWKTWFG